MNITIKNAIIASSGGALGFLGGYFISKKRHEKIANQEIQSVKDQYARLSANATAPSPADVASKYRSPSSQTEELIRRHPEQMAAAKRVLEEMGYVATNDEARVVIPDTEIDSSVELMDEAPRVRTEYTDEVAEAEQQKYETLPERTNEEEVRDTLVRFSFENAYVRQDSETPYLVTLEDYHDQDWAQHDKITLYWYKDEVLAGEDDEMIADVEMHVGLHNMAFFGLPEDQDVNTLYVRCEKLETDFEVFRRDVTYQQSVLQITPGKG